MGLITFTIRESNNVIKARNEILDLFTVRLKPKNSLITLFFKFSVANVNFLDFDDLVRFEICPKRSDCKFGITSISDFL